MAGAPLRALLVPPPSPLFPGPAISASSAPGTRAPLAIVEPPPVQQPPRPLEVVHSAAYVTRQRCQQLQLAAATPSGAAAAAAERLPAALTRVGFQPRGSNPVMSALARLDQQLDEIERDPPPLIRASYAAATSPAGAAVGEGLRAAAGLTVGTASLAVRAAAPAGGWALRQGLRAASQAAVGLAKHAFNNQQRPRK